MSTSYVSGTVLGPRERVVSKAVLSWSSILVRGETELSFDLCVLLKVHQYIS